MRPSVQSARLNPAFWTNRRSFGSMAKAQLWKVLGGSQADRGSRDRHYFMTMRRGGAVAVGAAGEITNVTQAFQPSGRFSLANSRYPLKLR
jgi:hypothetical protein